MNRFLELILLKRLLWQDCPHCSGTGKSKDKYFNKIICPVCKGQKIIRRPNNDDNPHKKTEKTLL
jgi:DnaJ-class molecular chaperone